MRVGLASKAKPDELQGRGERELMMRRVKSMPGSAH